MVETRDKTEWTRTGRWLTLSVLSLLLGLPGGVATAADKYVENNNDSGPGSLREAIANVGTGDNVVFQPTIAGQTITLLSDLNTTVSMNFVNDSGGDVTVEVGDYSLNAAGDTTIGTDSGLTWKSTGASSTTRIIFSTGSLTIDGLKDNVSISIDDVTGLFADAYGIFVSSKLNVNNGLSGTISATFSAEVLEGGAIGIRSGDALTINGGLSGTVSAVATDAHAKGIYSGDLTINGGLSGTVSAEATGNRACGIDSGDLTISGGLSGIVSANGFNDADGIIGEKVHIDRISGIVTATSSSDAHGIHSFGSINGGDANTPLLLSGLIAADGGREAYAIYGDDINIKVEGSALLVANGGTAHAVYGYGTITMNQGLSGGVGAGATVDDATGIHVENGTITVSNGLSGMVGARASRAACGFFADGGGIAITGGLSGTVSAEGETSAYGFQGYDSSTFLNNVHVDEISGTVSAKSNNGSAYGLWSNANINGGDTSTAMLISGSVGAEGASDVHAIHGDNINLKVDETGTLSATSSGGDAYAVFSTGTGDDQVELVAGCNAVGDFDLGAGTGDALTLSGSGGTTTLNGDIINVETCNVTGGIWRLNGNVGTDVTVTGGALCGSGRLARLVNDSIVAPGNSIGTLTVTGDYTNNAGSTLEIEINDAGTTPGVNNDLLDVAGTATVNGGTVRVVAAPGNYADGAKYTFLEAGSLAGSGFSGITDNLAFFDVSLGHNATGWFFTLARNRNPYEWIAHTPNQRAVGRYLDEIQSGATGDLRTVMNSLDTLSPSEARHAFDQMDGEIYGTLGDVGVQGTTLVYLTLMNRLRPGLSVCQPECRDCCRDDCSQWNSWAIGYGLGGNASDDGNAHGFGYSIGGTLIGLDRYLSADDRAGLFFAYGRTHVGLNGLSDSANFDNCLLGGYLTCESGRDYCTLAGGFGVDSYTVRRNIEFGAIDRTANGNHNGWQGGVYLERGRTYCWNYYALQPYGALQYIHVAQNGFTENGAQSVDLQVGNIDTNSFRTLLGMRALCPLGTIGSQVEFRSLWMHELLDSTRTVFDAEFNGSGPNFAAVEGVGLGRDWAILGTSASWCLREQCRLFASYDVMVNSQQTFHLASGGLEARW